MPKISVIMPVYNSEKYLREAIDSILSQTFTDFEFIILDDGSTDSSPAIVADYDDPRIRFYQNERNMGVAATLNRGLDLVTGEYIARMDADDISLPKRFEIQVAYMDAHPNVAVCGGAIELIGAQRGRHSFAQTPEQMRVDMLFSCCLAHPSVMMRGSVFGKGGLHYDEEFSKMEDYALWVETAREHDLSSVPDVLLQYRIHPGQVTQNYNREYYTQLRRLKEQQVEYLNLDKDGEGFEAFYKYCTGNAQWNEEEICALMFYLEKVRQQNCIYNEKLLSITQKAILYKILGEYPVFQANKIAESYGEKRYMYYWQRIKRVVRMWKR